ncbi:MAG: O-antigen ligase domain-containing protein [Xenococcaceae cyanobacterium]
MSNYQLKYSQQNSKLAWQIILSLFGVITLCFLVGIGQVLVPIFPLGSLAVGIFLYLRYPILYVGFTWWLWFLAPFIRRMIDHQAGHFTPGPWILSPLLVTFISAITLIKYLPKLHYRHSLPFLLSLAGVCYGFFIALLTMPIEGQTVIHFLSWSTPILFGFHLYVNWQDYPHYRQNLEKVFYWGVLVMGIYGIFQYLVAPQWDIFWLNSLGPASVYYGRPHPLGLRVWSTMMVPQKFGAVMAGGLLLLFVRKGIFRFLVAGVGYLAFVLTTIRTAWLNWLVGLLILLASVRLRWQTRIITSIIIASLLILPLTMVEPFASVVVSRMESFSHVEEDGSYHARLEGYNALIQPALSEFFGQGIGTKLDTSKTDLAAYDNGLLVLLFSLGWFGSIVYLSGIVLIFVKLLQGKYLHQDLSAIAFRAIGISTFIVQLGFNPVTIEEFALLVWAFASLAMASQKYHRETYLATNER